MFVISALYPNGVSVKEEIGEDESNRMLSDMMSRKPWLSVKEAWESVREELYWAFSGKQSDDCMYVDIMDIMFVA